MIKNILLIFLSSIILMAQPNENIIEFNVKNGSKIDSIEFAYGIIDQYIRQSNLEGNNFKVKLIRNINYTTKKNNKDGNVYEYTFLIQYKQTNNKNVFNNIVEIKCILIITDFSNSSNVFFKKDNKDRIIEIEVYTLDVANILK